MAETQIFDLEQLHRDFLAEEIFPLQFSTFLQKEDTEAMQFLKNITRHKRAFKKHYKSIFEV